MKRKNVLVVSVLTLTLLASTSAMAFADTATSGAAAAKASDHRGDIRAELNLTDAQMTLLDEARISDLKEAVANLVNDGTLTKAEGATLLADMTEKMADRGDGPFQDLTAAQKTALEAKLKALKSEVSEKNSGDSHADRAAVMTEAIASLVKDGVLTQAEADAITSNMPTEKADRGDGPFQNLTEKQKTALMSELEPLRASSMKQLVSDGTITQAQADLLLEHGMGKMGGPGKGKGL